MTDKINNKKAGRPQSEIPVNLTETEREALKTQRLKKRLAQAEQRAADKAAQVVYETSKNQQQFWASNRAKLDPTELQALEDRQTEFAILAMMVQEITTKLPTGALIGPEDGLPYPDLAYVEIQAWEQAANPQHRIVWHPNLAEFAELHKPENSVLLNLVRSADPDWFQFGYYTRFQEGILDEFVRVVAAFIKENPNHEAFDAEISKQIVAAWTKRQPRSSALVHQNLTENQTLDAAKPRLIGEDRLDAREELSKLPPNFHF